MPSRTERVRLTDEQIKALARFSEQTGMTKSDVIRKALEAYIDDFPDEEFTQGKRTDLKEDK